MIKTINSEYYGDQTRWFVATVVNSSPPAGLEGRIRIRIHGVHDPYTGNVKESDLPWAPVVMPLTEGGSSGIGRIPQVLPGAFVYGIFLDGLSSQNPIIIGSMTKNEYPTSVQVKASKDKTLSRFKINYEPEIKVNSFSENLQDDALPKGNQNRRRSQCIKFFIDNGYTPRQAAGITGCLEAVSRFITFDPDNNKTDYYGIAQWVRFSTRYNNLNKFASQFQVKELPIKFSVQLQYVLYELRTLFSSANSKLLQTEVIDGVGGSVDVISRYYLKDRTLFDGKVAVKLAIKAFQEAVY